MPRTMEIVTPLAGEDVLLFHALRGRDELSRTSEYEVELLSEKAFKVNEILGKNVTVKVQLADGSWRYFNGFVTRFAAGSRLGRYRRFTATINSWNWFLTRTSDCRVFQNKTVQEIVEEVFRDHPVADFKFELTGSYNTHVYCVQYRETDFNFVSRLLEHEGIYYYFQHTDGAHKMVLTDSTSMHQTTANYDTVPFYPPGSQLRPEEEHIHSWQFFRQVQPGVAALDDFDFERPSVDLTLQVPLVRQYTPSDYEIFDYPGFFTQKKVGEDLARVRIDEYGALFERAHGVSNARGLTVGSTFKLSEYPDGADPDQNREHLVLEASYDITYSDYEALPGERGSEFSCTFVAMATDQQFRPRRITQKPFVQGPQTAMVVGPAGDEIHTDKYGRVKVQFHWDRVGQNNENSSCWIRVSHPWAGKGWGAISTPRIGQEVIVDFLEGDPDQPIITGRVYNAESMPPFGGGDKAVVSGIKSDTHKGDGYNEMSFDDTPGTEKITVHGQYDMNTTVEHDQTDTINNNRTTTVAVDDTETIGSNQTISVGADQTLDVGANQKITIGADRTLDIGAKDTITVGADQKTSVGASQTIEVSADQTVSIGANRSVTVGANDEISAAAEMAHSAGANLALAAGADLTADASANVKISGGANVEIAAGATIKLSAGGSSIEIGASGVTISGTAMVTVTGGVIKLN